MTEVQEADIVWPWPGFLAEGEVAMIVANRKMGKGQLCCDVAGRFSNGWAMPPYGPSDPTAPGYGEFSPGQVLMVTPEDNTNSVVKPRLVAVGANQDRIFNLSHVIRSGGSGADTARSRFSLPQDIGFLRRVIAGKVDDRIYDVRLIIIDPLMAAVTSTIATNRGARLMVDKLQDLAAETGVAVLLTHHFNKGVTMANMHDRINGSGGLLDALRIVNVIVDHPLNSDIKVLFPLYNNLIDGREVEPVEYALGGDAPYSKVLYRIPPPRVSEENMDKLQALVLATLIDAGTGMSSQALAVRTRLDHSLVKALLRKSMQEGAIEKHGGAYIPKPALTRAVGGVEYVPVPPE
jgi:hypothetical protein